MLIYLTRVLVKKIDLYLIYLLLNPLYRVLEVKKTKGQ